MAKEKTESLHVGIIMDGNGRWAAQRGLPRVAGHRAGVDAVRRTVEAAAALGIRCLTVYAFSADNWRRPVFEVRSVLALIAVYLRAEQTRLVKQGVRLKAIGRRDRLPHRLLRAIEKTERATAAGRALLLRVAVDYSAREAVARAALIASLDGGFAREVSSADCMAHAITNELSEECGEVDLLIRTGGEQRLSDFLLWESAYAEIVFTGRMWPDFDEADLETALEEFRHRERRFGGIPAAATSTLSH